MNWSILALLACPLMMLICMRGMFSGNKEKNTDNRSSNLVQQELQQLQIQMAELMEQNHNQKKELEELRNHTNLQM